MTGRPPVVVYDENTDRELRRTRRLVMTLESHARFMVARCFVGWHVSVELNQPNERGNHETVVGYCEGVARMHGGISDVILLTLPGDLHDLANMHAYPLATVRSITTRGR